MVGEMLVETEWSILGLRFAELLSRRGELAELARTDTAGFGNLGLTVVLGLVMLLALERGVVIGVRGDARSDRGDGRGPTPGGMPAGRDEQGRQCAGHQPCFSSFRVRPSKYRAALPVPLVVAVRGRPRSCGGRVAEIDLRTRCALRAVAGPEQRAFCGRICLRQAGRTARHGARGGQKGPT